MKILQISAYFFPSYRGTELTIANLSQNLVKLGNEVDILTINTESVEKEEIWQNNINVHRCSPIIRYHRAIFSIEFFKKLIQAKDYDLYHVHIPFHSGLEMVLIASKKNSIPVVATHHGEGPKTTLIHGIISNAYNCFYRKNVLPHIERIIFFTDSYPKSLGLNNCINKNIRTIRPTVDLEVFSPKSKNQKIRKKYNLTDDDKIILFISALPSWDQTRGIYYLIKAIDIVKKDIPNIKLLIVGRGGMLPKLKSLTADLKLTQNIIFAGKEIREELVLYYAVCDFFVLPSLYESFGYVVIEAMASGKPVIVCDIPGVGELVENGKTGLKVPPGNIEALADAIIYLLQDDELRLKMGQNARREVEGRSWNDVAKDTLKIYKEVLKE